MPSSKPNPRGIAVDAQNVYWGDQGAIWSCPIAGCGSQPTMVVAANWPFQIALDSTYVYWADNVDGTVHRAPKVGGADHVLWDGGSGSVGLSGGQGQGCVVDTSFAYVTDYDFDLFRLPIAGGNLVPLYSPDGGFQGPAPVVVDSKSVYLGVPGQILQMDKTGANPTAVVSNVPGPDDLEIDPSTGDIYWADWGSGTGTDGTVVKIPADGGAPQVVHASLVTAEAVAVNSRYVFWLSNGQPTDDGSGATAGTGALYPIREVATSPRRPPGRRTIAPAKARRALRSSMATTARRARAGRRPRRAHRPR